MVNIPVASPPVLVLVTWPATRPADAFARALVEQGLAACVNVLPEMQSCYRWDGAVQQEAERQLVIKTTADRLETLEAWVNAQHPYDVPEFLVLHVTGGSDRYLEWVRASTRP